MILVRSRVSYHHFLENSKYGIVLACLLSGKNRKRAKFNFAGLSKILKRAKFLSNKVHFDKILD